MLRGLQRALRERRATPRGSYRPVSDYALIGDRNTAALVATDGSIDWTCLPRFDSAAVFCRILDDARGGTFRVGPVGPSEVRRDYLEGTAVLATEHHCGDGRIRVTDFFSLAGGGPGTIEWEALGRSRIVRCIDGLSGATDVEIRFHPTFGFARARTDLQPMRDGAVGAHRREWVSLRCPVPLHADDRGGLRAVVRVRAGDRLWLRLSHGTGRAPLEDASSDGRLQSELLQTLDEWRREMSSFRWDGPYGGAVRRSALVMKLLTYQPTAALVAAPTSSLPEQLGPGRNFDYRYSWVRDSSLAVRGLTLVGFGDEARRMLKWMLNTLTDTARPDEAVALTVDGRPPPPERRLRHLEGYQGTQPVIVGFEPMPEVDDYGELLDALAVAPEVVEYRHWRVIRKYANSAALKWHTRDRSIWEIPGRRQRYVYSSLMCWMAVDRAIRIGRHHGKTAPYRALNAARAAIRKYVLTRGFDEEERAFTQVFGRPGIDASSLVIPLAGLLPATDPRMRSTIEAVRRRLAVGPLVYRYLVNDMLPGLESAFVICSFWLSANLTLLGDLDGAREVFEGVLAHASDLGLLSEEIDVDTGELRGNYPQLLSHLALIRSAYLIGLADRWGVDELRRNSPYALLSRHAGCERADPGMT